MLFVLSQVLKQGKLPHLNRWYAHIGAAPAVAEAFAKVRAASAESSPTVLVELCDHSESPIFSRSQQRTAVRRFATILMFERAFRPSR